MDKQFSSPAFPSTLSPYSSAFPRLSLGGGGGSGNITTANDSQQRHSHRNPAAAAATAAATPLHLRQQLVELDVLLDEDPVVARMLSNIASPAIGVFGSGLGSGGTGGGRAPGADANKNTKKNKNINPGSTIPSSKAEPAAVSALTRPSLSPSYYPYALSHHHALGMGMQGTQYPFSIPPLAAGGGGAGTAATTTKTTTLTKSLRRRSVVPTCTVGTQTTCDMYTQTSGQKGEDGEEKKGKASVAVGTHPRLPTSFLPPKNIKEEGNEKVDKKQEKKKPRGGDALPRNSVRPPKKQRQLATITTAATTATATVTEGNRHPLLSPTLPGPGTKNNTMEHRNQRKQQQ